MEGERDERGAVVCVSCEGLYCVVNNVKVCELGNVARVYM